MATKKSTSKKPTSKKPATKKAAKKAAPKKEVVKYTATDVALTAPQSKILEMVERNQDRLQSHVQDMLKIANNSGERLIKLRDAIQKQYGRVWKAWAQTPGNLPISYEQASKYMKLAGASDDEFEKLDSTSIDGAVKQLEHMRKPEKTEKAKKAASAKKAAAGGSQIGIISPATIQEINGCTDVDELRGLIDLCKARIEELEAGSDDIDAEYEEVDDADDADDIADVIS